MAFRLVSSGGSVQDPAVVNMQASGTIWTNSVVVRDVATNVVSAAASSSTTTNVVGVSLDYVQGASDTYVRVIPFVPGQLWEADTVGAITTSQVLLRHTLYNSLLVNNITNTYETAATGIFLAYAVTGSTSGSGKIIGTFLAHTPLKSGGYTIAG